MYRSIYSPVYLSVYIYLYMYMYIHIILIHNAHDECIVSISRMHRVNDNALWMRTHSVGMHHVTKNRIVWWILTRITSCDSDDAIIILIHNAHHECILAITRMHRVNENGIWTRTHSVGMHIMWPRIASCDAFSHESHRPILTMHSHTMHSHSQNESQNESRHTSRHTCEWVTSHVTSHDWMCHVTRHVARMSGLVTSHVWTRMRRVWMKLRHVTCVNESWCTWFPCFSNMCEWIMAHM